MVKRGGLHALSARIKRLMQKDEQVGKIAQATPVMIGERRRRSLARGERERRCCWPHRSVSRARPSPFRTKRQLT